MAVLVIALVGGLVLMTVAFARGRRGASRPDGVIPRFAPTTATATDVRPASPPGARVPSPIVLIPPAGGPVTLR